MIQTIVGIEGMACSMCEAHISDAIRQAFPIKKVKTSRSQKKAEIISPQPLDQQTLRSTIEQLGYTVSAISSEPYVKKGLFG